MAVMPIDRETADALLTTTRSVRRRLDLRRPVERGVLEDCLTVALQAPNGSGIEPWRWLVVTDACLRAQIGDIYHDASEWYQRWLRRNSPEVDIDADTQLSSAKVLWDHLGDVPVLVFPCYQREKWHVDNPNREFVAASLYGSIFPAVWSFQLAARARGLGTCFVTTHLQHADLVRSLLHIPDELGQAGLIAVAYHTGKNFKAARRRPLNEVVRWEQWS
jgi:nitroreductase